MKRGKKSQLHSQQQQEEAGMMMMNKKSIHKERNCNTCFSPESVSLSLSSSGETEHAVKCERAAQRDRKAKGDTRRMKRRLEGEEGNHIQELTSNQKPKKRRTRSRDKTRREERSPPPDYFSYTAFSPDFLLGLWRKNFSLFSICVSS